MFLYEVDDEIQLKLITPQDFEELYAFIDRSRSYLREWLGWVDQTNRVEDIAAYENKCLQKFANNEGLSTMIIYKGKLVGKISINTMNWQLKKGEIGYYIDEFYQGSGIATRAVKGIIDIGFNHYKLNKIEIHAAVENVKSRQIPERLGFTQEGIIREAEWLHDRYVDNAIYGLLASEWLGIE